MVTSGPLRWAVHRGSLTCHQAHSSPIRGPSQAAWPRPSPSVGTESFPMQTGGGESYTDVPNSSRQLRTSVLDLWMDSFPLLPGPPPTMALFSISSRQNVGLWGKTNCLHSYDTNPNTHLFKGAAVPLWCPETPCTTVVPKNVPRCLPFWPRAGPRGGFGSAFASFASPQSAACSGPGCSCKQPVSAVPSLKIVVFVVTEIFRSFSQWCPYLID